MKEGKRGRESENQNGEKAGGRKPEKKRNRGRQSHRNENEKKTELESVWGGGAREEKRRDRAECTV